ncbi:hypothetical protein AALA54_05295 [Oscillospiraceae bacterium 44-34]
MKKKALSLALAALMLVSLTLTGCQKKDPPAAGDKVAVALFEMILKNDASSAVELFGYASEEEARKDMGLDGNIYEELADELAAQFTGMGLTASSEDVQGFVDAFMSMFKNVELTAKVKESNEKEGTSVVTCTISTFDANALNTAMSEALENIDPDAEFSTILSAIADVIADITPSGETADFDVDFELQKMEINGKEKEVWLPVDANEFGNLISTTAMGG